VDFERVGNTIEICYQLKHLSSRECVWIEIYYSVDGGQEWRGPLKRVEGDAGLVEYGGNKRVVWDVFGELEKINGVLAFEVRAAVKEKEWQRENMFVYSFSETAPLGVMFARVKRWGWFVRWKTDTHFHETYDYACDRRGNVDRDFGETYYRVENEERKSRLGISGGIVCRFAYCFYLFAGGGYGERQVQWRASLYRYADDGKVCDLWLQCRPESFSGMELDTGILLRYRRLNLFAGFSGINGRFWELSGGVGILF